MLAVGQIALAWNRSRLKTYDLFLRKSTLWKK
jgi:hypothetical protein